MRLSLYVGIPRARQKQIRNGMRRQRRGNRSRQPAMSAGSLYGYRACRWRSGFSVKTAATERGRPHRCRSTLLHLYTARPGGTPPPRKWPTPMESISLPGPGRHSSQHERYGQFRPIPMNCVTVSRAWICVAPVNKDDCASYSSGYGCSLHLSIQRGGGAKTKIDRPGLLTCIRLFEGHSG